MHVKALAALERLQGDAYAQQQARGFRLLRFIPPLEAEYLAHMRADQRASALICTVTALVIWTIFIGLDFSRLDVEAELAGHHHDFWVVVALRASTFALLATLVWCLLR